MQIAAIVLAAGEGRRIGGPKALLRVADTTFLRRVCGLFAGVGVDAVVAVLGAHAERVRAEADLSDLLVSLVVNDAWREGMLSSIRRGLDAAEALGADAVLVHPVDNPLVAPETIRAVIAALRAGAVIAVPSHGGRRGHPAGFGGAARLELRRVPPDRGARGLLSLHPDWVVHVAAGSDCLVDIDTLSELRSRGLGAGTAR